LSVFLLVMLVCGLLISPKIATPTSVALVLLYLGNWVQAAGTDFGGLAHTWSLAVEEQFYVIWPIVVLTVTRKAWRHALLWIAAVGACLSAVARLLLWDGGAGATRIYNGSDTRADAILLGCLLGAALHKGREGVNRPGLATLALVAAGALSLTHDFGRLVVLPTVVPVLTVLAIWALTRAKQYSGWLSSRGLVAIGKRSYGFYLWHWPVQFILLRVDAVTEHRLLHWFLLLTLSWSLTVLSWRYVEQPFLNGRWRGAPRPAVVPA
jgi:peptidoglycan/LPS O-acetylase OafA/YrhL